MWSKLITAIVYIVPLLCSLVIKRTSTCLHWCSSLTTLSLSPSRRWCRYTWLSRIHLSAYCTQLSTAARCDSAVARQTVVGWYDCFCCCWHCFLLARNACRVVVGLCYCSTWYRIIRRMCCCLFCLDLFLFFFHRRGLVDAAVTANATCAIAVIHVWGRLMM